MSRQMDPQDDERFWQAAVAVTQGMLLTANPNESYAKIAYWACDQAEALVLEWRQRTSAVSVEEA